MTKTRTVHLGIHEEWANTATHLPDARLASWAAVLTVDTEEGPDVEATLATWWYPLSSAVTADLVRDLVEAWAFEERLEIARWDDHEDAPRSNDTTHLATITLKPRY